MAVVNDTDNDRGTRGRALRFSVLVPLFAVRGDVVENLRTWTDQQTLAREHYQLVIASDGTDPALERHVAVVLAAQDVIERAPCAHGVELYNAAAARAAAPWLVLTEAHCLADPECLAALSRTIDQDGGFDAAGLVVGGHIRPTPFAHMLARWLEHVFAEWSRPGQWRRLSFFGAAIRRDAFQDVADAVDARYGLFSPALLSARLHQRGARIGRVSEAQVFHIADEDIREADEHTADWAYGECAARADFDTRFCERYFGHASVWTNRLRYRPEIARPVAGVLAHAVGAGDGAGSRWIARELAAWLPAGVAGVRPYLLWERARLLCSEYADRFPLGPGWRWSRLQAAHGHAVRVAQLKWIRERVASPSPVAQMYGSWDVDDIPDGALVGIHGLESHGGRWFRWTEPVVLIRQAPDGASALIVDTGGLRGRPLDYVHGVYTGGGRVPAESLSAEAGRLVVRLPRARNRRATAGIAVLCRPLVPSRTGVDDSRRLGMPVFSVELRGTG